MRKAAILYEVEMIYKARALRAKMKQKASEERLEEAYPELGPLRQSLQDLRCDRLLLETVPGEGGDRERQCLDDAIKDKEKKLEAFYQSLPEEDKAESFYYCSYCKDQGFRPPCPKCYPQTLRQVLNDMARPYMPSAQARRENVDLTLFSDKPIAIGKAKATSRALMERYVAMMDRLVEDFPKHAENYYFTGKTGTGKTFLASSVVNSLLDQGVLALFIPALSFEEGVGRIRTLQKSFGSSQAAIDQARENYELFIEADFLVLDDFGLSSGQVQDPLTEVYQLLQERNLRGKTTILTSNLTLAELKKIYNERLVSRILGNFKILPFVGDDLRVKLGQGI